MAKSLTSAAGAKGSHSPSLKEWWEDESLINQLFVKPFVSLATLPGEVNRGEIPLFNEEGHTSQELIERAAEAGSTIPLSGLVAGAGGRAADDVLFANPWIGKALEDMVYSEPLGGSTGAKKLYDPEAARSYVVKPGASPEHIAEEHIADDLYRAMGVPLPETWTGQYEGAPVKISQFLEGATTPQSLNNERALAENFLADAFLANWDVRGMLNDNVLVDAFGVPRRVDTGGSLRYRAMGEPKGKAFGPEVGELSSMRKGPFADLTDEDLAEQFYALAPRKEEIFATEMPEELRQVLQERWKYLEDKFGPPSLDPEEEIMQAMLKELESPEEPNFGFGDEVNLEQQPYKTAYDEYYEQSKALDEMEAASVPPSEADTLAMTGSKELDDKILAASKLGWKADYLMGLAKLGLFEGDQASIDWYLDPKNLNDFLANNTSTTLASYVKASAIPKPSKPKLLGDDPYGLSKLPAEAASAPFPEEIPKGDIIDKYHSLFGPIREELYRRGRDPNELLEVQRLLKAGDVSGAAQLSEELKNLYLFGEPERLTTSLIAPHALRKYDEGGTGYNKVDLPETLTFPENMAQQATDLGFDINNILVKGTRHPTDRFLDPSMKTSEKGLFFAPMSDPNWQDIVGSYGSYFYPVVARAKDPLVQDFGKRSYSDVGLDRLVQQARDEGRTMAVAKNIRDEPNDLLQDQYIVTDPRILRSIWAAFDPKRLEENNLLASQLPVGPNFDFLIPEDEERRRSRLGGGGF